MRVVFVTAEYVTEENYDGGLANYLHKVALALKELGHTPVIVILTDTFIDDLFFHKGIAVHRVRFSRSHYLDRLDSWTKGRFTHFLYFLRASWVLNNHLKSMHRNTPISIIQYTHLGGVGLFRPKKIPNITRLSSYTPLWRKYGGYSNLTSLEAALQSFIERWALKRTEHIFGPCIQVARIVEEEIGKPVEVIETPFVMDVTAPDETLYMEKLDGKNYFLFFGTLSYIKGVVTIAETLPVLLEKYPDVYFVFAGKESSYQGEPMMNYVRKKAERFVERVVHLGKIKHEQLYPIIKHAFAVVLPSLFDNFPNTCLEAMWHRRVIIGTEGASFEQLLVDGVSGFLCKGGDPASLLSKMDAVLELSEERRVKVGEAAYQRVLGLQPEKVVKQLITLYEKTIALSIS